MDRIDEDTLHTPWSDIQKVKVKKGWGFWVGMAAVTFVVIPLVIFFTMAAIGPGTEVVLGKMLNKKYASFIRDNGLIEPSEEIEYWYSDAFSDFRNGFYFFTDKKVLLYCRKWEKPAISVPFSSIVNIEFQKEPSFFEDSKITLILSDSSTLFFPVSSDNNGDEKFLERMKQIWKSRKSEAVSEE